MDISAVNKTTVADLKESQCKQALLLACKLAWDTSEHHSREVVASAAYERHAAFMELQFSKLALEATKLMTEKGAWKR